jgi:lipopolysaccharide/colanic/teichoic acid biosynthesis glycosyltransferase
MRVPSPTSRGALRLRFRAIDIVVAIASPMIALYLSDAYLLATGTGWVPVGIYSILSILFSGMAFLFFRTERGVLRHFSVDDALELSKAVAAAMVLTCVADFALTRLEGVPRSTPIIHGLILLTGLILVRVLASIASKESLVMGSMESAPEQVILVSSSSLSSLYIKLLHAEGAGCRRVISVLDSRPGMIGRAVEGVPIVGAPRDLEAVVEEYRVHGLQIDRVVFGGENADVPDPNVDAVMRVCRRQKICMDYLPRPLNLKELDLKVQSIRTNAAGVAMSPYFRWKPAIDMLVAAVLIVVLLPLVVGAALVALIDVGSPVLFWQRRLGARGRWFLMYKFRTLRPPLNRHGGFVPADQRLSRIGRLLRDTSLDELPQLFSVLVGDMSIIGPRPLLPVDQPRDASVRLMVPPGITGWAQVNGRKSLTPEEKDQLDAWYIRNASLAVDALIVVKTIRLLLSGVGGSRGGAESTEGFGQDGRRQVERAQV